MDPCLTANKCNHGLSADVCEGEGRTGPSIPDPRARVADGGEPELRVVEAMREGLWAACKIDRGLSVTLLVVMGRYGPEAPPSWAYGC